MPVVRTDGLGGGVRSRDYQNFLGWVDYHISLALLRMNEYYNAKISELEKTADNSGATTFWTCLKSMDDTRKEKGVPLVSEENWLQYFRSLHSNELLNPAQQTICNELGENERHGQESRPLDYPINENEIRKAAKKLKNNKSPFSDKIRNEMIKASIDTLMLVYYKLFNSIIRVGTMPRTRCGGLIAPIYKAGRRSDPANYRGICLSSCIGKLFCSILNQRLIDHVAFFRGHPTTIFGKISVRKTI